MDDRSKERRAVRRTRPRPTRSYIYNILYFWSGEEIERPETQHVVDVDFVASFASEINKRASDLASILHRHPPTEELMTSRRRQRRGGNTAPGVVRLRAARHYVCPGLSSRVGVSLKLACVVASSGGRGTASLPRSFLPSAAAAPATGRLMRRSAPQFRLEVKSFWVTLRGGSEDE